jgi:hypothetical protein
MRNTLLEKVRDGHPCDKEARFEMPPSWFPIVLPVGGQDSQKLADQFRCRGRKTGRATTRFSDDLVVRIELADL